LHRARGEFIAYLDSDDLWMPNYLSRCMEGLRATNAGFVFANWQGILENNSINYPDYFAKRASIDRFETQAKDGWFVLQPHVARRLFLETSTALPSGTVIRRNAIRTPWDERARVGEDRLFLLDIIVDSQCAIAFTKDVLWSHRLHTANSYMGNPDIGMTAAEDIYSKEAILKKYQPILSRDEIEIVRSSMAGNYFDWGYYESQRGHRAHAIQRYWQSLQLRPAAKTVTAMMKAAIKPTRQQH
jgi:glycosyltransferase involved in cell wall biosynthesis